MRLATVLIALALAAPLSAAAFDFNKLDLNKLRDASEKLKAANEKLKPLRPMSEQDEIAFGRDVAANVMGAAPPVKDAVLQEYVNRVGLWLALHSDRPGLPWHFGVLDSNDINAFSTPGGYVLITRGLFLQCHDESELAGVLAHEIGHVMAKHALNTMKKDALAGLASDALSDYAARKGGENYRKLVSAGTEVYVRGFDKEDEYAADRLGVVIAARAGYDPYGLPAVLEALASINPSSDAVALMFKTHPDPQGRLELLTNEMEGRLDRYAEAPKVGDRFQKMVQAHLATGAAVRK
jgi:predicted Zn-dependent protease